jgi:hypothetical protein
MNRRRFLQGTGLAGATAPSAATQTAARPKPILITCGGARLAQSLAAGLQATYPIRLTERAPVRTDHEFVECALGHDSATQAAVRGAEAIVHVAEPRPQETPGEQIDFLTRCTYNLLWAAAEESVPRVVLLSTLDLMTAYDPDFTVSETWRTRPPAEPNALGKHLAEFTCREFAREGRISIVVLRLGKVVREEEVRGQPFDPLWVEERDVAHAVSCALAAGLTAKLGRWQIFHIQPDSPRSRFAVNRAKQALGYQPKFRW